MAASPYYLPAKLDRGNGYVPYSERKQAKHRDLLVPHYRGGRWRGPGTKRSTRTVLSSEGHCAERRTLDRRDAPRQGIIATDVAGPSRGSSTE